MEILLGILPAGGGNLYLARKIGRSRALEICLSGRDFSAVEAERYGAINRALPAAEIDSYVDRLVRQIAASSSLSIARNKAAINLFEDRLSADFIHNNDLFVDLALDPEFGRRVDHFMSHCGGTAAGEVQEWAHWSQELSNKRETSLEVIENA